ncbi:universal stress protein [Xanthobacter sp. KR7-65]|uniref:universal stress protein n=1 Tax=Xanthobacter sp. KR7-65 TaxID=3156612 RepID=UPI0032B49757
MAYKDLLVQLSSYPEATSQSSVERAVDIAATLGARISALTFEIDIPVPGSPLARAILDLPGIAAAEREKSINGAREVISTFNNAARLRGVCASHSVERGLTAQIPDAVSEHARLRDMTIIPLQEDSFQQYIAECVIFGSGRPVLVMPDKPTNTGGITFDRIGIAWDFSRPAARALADALPLLQRAKVVRAVTVTHEKNIDTRQARAELANHLAVHGIDLVLEEEDAAGRTVGRTLVEYAEARKLDLLVMGAFGHSRIRDLILGGATKSILEAPPLPVMLSH